MTQCFTFVISAAALFMSAVGLQESGGSKQVAHIAQASGPVLPPGLFLEKEPEGAKTVEEVKNSAKAGDKVVIRGRIGGSKNPFVEKRAVFTLMGAALKACSDNPEDKCATPWDYCCDAPATIAKHSATIQVVDAEGAPLRLGLKGNSGLKELSEVIVRGAVKEAKDKVLIINATGLYVASPHIAGHKTTGK